MSMGKCEYAALPVLHLIVWLGDFRTKVAMKDFVD